MLLKPDDEVLVDVTLVRRQLADLVTGVRERPGPAVVEFVVPRLGPHSKGDDTRDAAELAALWEDDWAARYRARHPEPSAPPSRTSCAT